MHIALYSFFLIVVSAVASLVLFLNIKKNNLLAPASFFKHYAWGFLLLTLIPIPIFIINLGIQINYDFLLILYALGFFGTYFSYLIFYRGTTLLYSKDRFTNTLLPLIFLPIFTVIAVISLFLIKIEVFIIYTAMIWGFLLPIAAYLSALFFYFFIKGAPFDTMKRKPYALLLSFAWLFILILDVFLWLNVATYPEAFWIFKIAGQKTYFFLRIIAYLMMFIGVLLYGKYLRRPQLLVKE